MPEWVHNRAEHLLAKNPDMPKSMAFAVATQQGHAMGKTPKGYGTAKGRREAKAKFDTPKGAVHKANPGGLDSPKLAAIEGDELPGGKSDNVPYASVDARQLAMGAKVEMEHTKRKMLAREIAKDHLAEIPDYYSRLKKMEDEAPKSKEAMNPDHPYLLDQVGKPKTRNLSAMPPNKSLVVKKAAATGVFGLPLERDPMSGTGQKEEAAKRLSESQKVGVPEPPKTTPLSIKTGALSYHGLRTAIGAGTGLAAGAAAGAAAGGEGHRLRGALLGGAGGAALGTAVGYAAPKYLASRAGTMSKATGKYAVNPATRGEALRQVGQSARQDIGELAQGLGQRVQRSGEQMQQGVHREQLDAARAAHAASLPPPVPTAATRVAGSAAATGAASPMALQKAASAKLAFSESMYSGGMGGGPPLVQTNYIPPFKNPPVKTAGPPPPDEKKSKLAAMADELMKLNAVNAITPGGRLAQSRKVGQPSTARKPGPSIAQISKPIGYGEPIEGATKTG